MQRVYTSVLARTALIEDPSTRSLVSRIMASTTYSVGTIVALGTIGIDTSPVLAAMGVSGATIGFACKDIGANIAAGLSLAAKRPFAHGQRISVGKDHSGVVDHWDTRYLYLRGPKNQLIHVPNAVVFNSILTVHNPTDDAFERDENGDVISRPMQNIKEMFTGETASTDAAAEDGAAKQGASTTSRKDGAAGRVGAKQAAVAANMNAADVTDRSERLVRVIRIVSWIALILFVAASAFLVVVLVQIDNAFNDENSIFGNPWVRKASAIADALNEDVKH